MTMLFAACNHQSADNKADSLQNTIGVDRDESCESNETHVCMSEDGRIVIESGMHPYGGTAPDYWTKWTIKDIEGKSHSIESPVSANMKKVHCLTRDDGSAYYVVNCSAKESSTDGYAWLEAYEIVGDTVERVNVMDGSRPFGKDDRFSVSYYIPSWYFATMGAGYDWILEYDSRTRELYVPLTSDDHEITDRYHVWIFDGKRFEYEGNRHNMHLNDSLSRYARLLRYVTTKDYIVRVDMLADGELRYASWHKPKTTKDYPDIVITGGRKVNHKLPPDQVSPCDDYRFKNVSYRYIVNYCEVEETDEGRHEHHDYLMVTNHGKVLLKQEIEK